MRALPLPDPGNPDTRSATRFLIWAARRQLPTIVGGMSFGIVWMVSQALMPAAIGRAIDAGLAARNTRALITWAAVLLGLGIVQAVCGVMRHRMAVANFLGGAYRTVQLTVRQANRLGATLPDRVATGEVVSIGTSDISHIGGALDITARAAGSVIAIVTVAVVLLAASVPLGLAVLIGVPVLMGAVSLLIAPLHHRQQAYRDQQGHLTTRASDIVAGLRVLRGVGGEAAFAGRYRAESQDLRAAGVRVARVESVLEAAQVLLPGVFVVIVTWLGARFAVRGEISPGELVAFYGYAAFLVFPLRNITEAVDRFIRGHVAARRVVRILTLAPTIETPGVRRDLSTVDGTLVDPLSGLVVRPGAVTAIAASQPEDAAALADRLGRYVDSDVTLGGVPLREVSREAVRERILVADNDARLFSNVLRTELDSRATATGADIAAALDAASATDILDALPEGLDAIVAERGREFSGGQQQRLRLARALLVDAPILVLVEPTSAVDAHTEARIGERLRGARRGRTTVVCTTSPLLLDRSDHVAFLDDGKVVAEGTHAELLRSEPAYAALVTRGEDS